MDFFNQTGKMAIGSRLRMLTDKVTNDAELIHKMYGMDIRAKWFPVLFVLSHGEAKTITAIAKEIGHSHPSVSNIVKEMVARRVVKETKDKSDGRRNLIVLSSKGRKMSEILIEECSDMAVAVDSILSVTRSNLWQAIEEWECLLSEKSLLDRVKEVKKQRESKDIKIVSYQSCYQEAFKSLNEEWIKKYFKMEEADYIAVNNPEKYILEKGGEIFVALYKGEPVGVCALLKMFDGHYDYEVAKLAVSPKVQGKGIGFLLGQATVNKAKELGAKYIYLESNTVLEPAIHIYEKLGFKKVFGHSTPYQRCNIQMELIIE
ncbi:MAG: bifunctional helix-turn-helix transcriptional regulator/GNAT family N-acetyltransferase [Proteiniphilum sp.]|nr:bifunctional helix-turn-helix transcriptional regulator/GNAT family N-acetyltransferase [Proteiniphilum sp.]